MRVSPGEFTLRQMILLTHQNKPNRFEYMSRDVLKNIHIIQETELNPERPSETSKTITIRSFSYPNYYPYVKPPKTRQRNIKHQYDTVLSIRADDNGKASLDSKVWAARLGSQKKWNSRPPQSQVKQIYAETRARWKAKRDKDIATAQRTISNRHERSLAVRAAKEAYRQTIAAHRETAKYLDVGDWNSRVLGINGDAYGRVHPVLKHYGHLYGKSPSSESGDITRPFLPKHLLRIIDILIRKGLLQ